MSEVVPIVGPAPQGAVVKGAADGGSKDDRDSVVVAQLSAEQQSAVKELQAALEPLTDRQRAFCDIPCLLRYLRARDYDVKKSRKLLLSTLQWRHSFRPHRISPDDVEEEALTGKVYRNGYDRAGRPIIYMRPGRENTKNYDRQVMHLVYHLESAVRSMGPGVESFVFIIDYSGFSLSKSPPMAVSKRVLSILSDNYPERLGKAFLVSYPFYMGAFWAAISPFLNKVTKSKITFVKGHKVKEVIGEFVDHEVLEAAFSGAKNYEYVHETYWGKEKEYWTGIREHLDALDLEQVQHDDIKHAEDRKVEEHEKDDHEHAQEEQ
eukprot:ANDGO_05786.mRNA.1 CRAL-TRIO domain-containing protein C23B6.04c